MNKFGINDEFQVDEFSNIIIRTNDGNGWVWNLEDFIEGAEKVIKRAKEIEQWKQPVTICPIETQKNDKTKDRIQQCLNGEKPIEGSVIKHIPTRTNETPDKVLTDNTSPVPADSNLKENEDSSKL